MPPRYRGVFIRLVVVYQLGALLLVVAGVGVLIGGSSGLYWSVAGVLLSFLAAFADAWVLLIEINR
jgi:hypothetical protein